MWCLRSVLVCGYPEFFVCLFFHREKVLDLQEFYILVALTELGQDSSLPPAQVTAHQLLHQISDTKPWGRSWYMKHWQRPCLQTQSFLSRFCQFYSILVAMSYILSTSFSIILVYTPISPGPSRHVWSACFSWVYDDLWILDGCLIVGQGDCEVWNSVWDFEYVFTGYFWVHAPLAESHYLGPWSSESLQVSRWINPSMKNYHMGYQQEAR